MEGGSPVNLTVAGITAGAPIPADFALCVPDPDTHAAFAPNKNPAMSWNDVPEGTQSFAVMCWDRTVPTSGEDVNQEDREVPPDLPRTDFFHWVLVDLHPTVRNISEGEYSDGVTARGKAGPDGPGGTRQGLNDYTGWFTGDADMEGAYFGYDGPAPPWNDSSIHEYVFAGRRLGAPVAPERRVRPRRSQGGSRRRLHGDRGARGH